MAIRKNQIMRIAVLTSSYPRFPGDGTAPFVKSLAESMARQGHDIIVVAPYDPVIQPDIEDCVKVYRFRYIWPPRWHIMGHARSLESDVRLNGVVIDVDEKTGEANSIERIEVRL